jgi:hypothetical protein
MQERIVTKDVRMNPPSAKPSPAHRRRLSDSTDSNYERSPRIVEMDTCHLRSRSTRFASGRYTPDHRSSGRLATDLAPPFSPLSAKQPSRLSTRRDPVRHAKTAQNTPRFSGAEPPYAYDSPVNKSVDGLTTPRPLWHRDLLVSPRYMGGTASSAAKTRCHSAPRQPAEVPRASLTSQAGSRKSASKRMQSGYFSEATRTGYSGLIEEAARDYYLDRMW